MKIEVAWPAGKVGFCQTFALDAASRARVESNLCSVFRVTIYYGIWHMASVGELLQIIFDEITRQQHGAETELGGIEWDRVVA